MTTDPRPQPRVTPDGAVQVAGWRCTECAYPVTQLVLRCPLCRAAVAEELFASEGTVFASTRMHVGVPGHPPPYDVAYVVLDEGPRVLVHSSGEAPLAPGSRARLVAVSDRGDLVAEQGRGERS